MRSSFEPKIISSGWTTSLGVDERLSRSCESRTGKAGGANLFDTPICGVACGFGGLLQRIIDGIEAVLVKPSTATTNEPRHHPREIRWTTPSACFAPLRNLVKARYLVDCHSDLVRFVRPPRGGF